MKIINKKELLQKSLIIGFVLFLLVYLPVFAQEEGDFFDNGLLNWTVGGILSFLQSVTSVFVYLLGSVLDLVIATFIYVVRYTVVLMHDLVGATGIETLWKLVRDLVGLLIAAMFLYSAARLLFEKNNKFEDVRKLLFALVMSALFVNFSGFFVLFALDISNILAVTFISSVEQIPRLSENSNFVFQQADTIRDPSSKIKLNLIVLNVVVIASKTVLSLGILWAVVLFVKRFFLAVMAMITSPIMILFFLKQAGVEDYVQGIFTWWKKIFFGAVTFPVVYLFLLYIAVYIFSTFEKIFVTETLSSGGGFYETVVPGFIFVIFIYYVFKLINAVGQNLISGNGLDKMFSKLDKKNDLLHKGWGWSLKFGSGLRNRLGGYRNRFLGGYKSEAEWKEKYGNKERTIGNRLRVELGGTPIDKRFPDNLKAWEDRVKKQKKRERAAKQDERLPDIIKERGADEFIKQLNKQKGKIEDKIALDGGDADDVEKLRKVEERIEKTKKQKEVLEREAKEKEQKKESEDFAKKLTEGPDEWEKRKRREGQ